MVGSGCGYAVLVDLASLQSALYLLSRLGIYSPLNIRAATVYLHPALTVCVQLGEAG